MSEETKREHEAGAAPAEHRTEAAPEAGTASSPEQAPASSGEASGTQAAAPAEAASPHAAPKHAAPTASAAASPEASAAAAAPTGEAAPPRRKETDEEKAARRKAALEAREAAAQAKAAEAAAPAGGEGGEAAAPPKPPSPNQPRLDRAVALLRELVAEDAVEEAYINEPNDHLPTLVVRSDRWAAAAALFRDHEELGCRYLRNVSGVDYETYMEVVYYPLNMERRETYCVKVRTDREHPSVPSVTAVWETANWNEREIYDLLGIDFPGHPNMTRIMMPDDWVGHPLRKDYVPLDPEV